MKGRTGTGQGMDEGPTSHSDNGGVRRVGAGAKGDHKRDGVHSDGIRCTKGRRPEVARGGERIKMLVHSFLLNFFFLENGLNDGKR